MAYFHRGNDQTGYSDAFEEYRNIIISQWFPMIMLGILLLVGIPVYMVRRSAMRVRNDYKLTVGKYRFPVYCTIHPFKGFTILKEDKKGSLPLAVGLMTAFFIVSVISRQATGFQFNENRVDQFNVFVEFGKSVGVALVFVLANWAVSTILDGKGTLKEVFIFGSYSLTPYIIGTIPIVLFSNIAVSDERAFYTMMLTFLQVWTVLCILNAVKEVHQFTVTKTLMITFITIIGIILVIAVIAVIYSMFTQMISWVSTIINELMLRM
jgi:hypothetical protein